MLLEVFLGLLDEIDFKVIHKEEHADGFRVIASSRPRRSQLSMTMMNMFTGYVPRNRLAVELEARNRGDATQAVLRCSPYLDVLDMPAPSGDPREEELSLKLADLVTDRLNERMGKPCGL